MNKRNYDILKALISVSYVCAAGAAIVGALKVSDGNWMLAVIYFLSAFMCIVQAQLISLLLNVADDVSNVAGIQKDNMDAIRKHAGAQTSLLAVMAQNAGVDADVINKIIANVKMEIPSADDEDSVD